MQYNTPDAIVAEVRKFVANLHRPERLDTPLAREFLRAHGRMPLDPSLATVGPAAAKLIADKITEHQEAPDSTWAQRLPYSVLETCFVRGRKNWQAAEELGLSERQLSRERTRALKLLAARLASPAETGVSPDRVPAIEGHVGRDALVHGLASALVSERFVAVVGQRGAGKTAVVAALARLVRDHEVWWLRIRPGLNDCLESFLLELGRTLAREDFRALRDYLLAALPSPNLAVATRLALDGVARSPRLLVIDDFDRAGAPAAIQEFLEEAVDRLAEFSVITVGSGVAGRAIFEVPSLSREEVDVLMQRRGLACSDTVLDTFHALVAGHTGVATAAVKLWSGQAGTYKALARQVAQRGLTKNLLGLVEFVRAEAV
jgi:energy-coupling factor transporter ATP-binding protein EcfA2